MRPAFWSGKRVLVTGHTGFKGSWLSLWLEALGSRVTGYSLEPPSDPSLFELARVAAGIEDIRADILDLDRLQASLAGREIVIHMAAQSLVRRSYEEPLETYATNVMGTANVLEAARRTPGVRVVIVVTSDKCYENREQAAGYREADPMGGYDPYSSSKGCAELVTAAWRSSYFNPADYPSHGVAVASVRAGNVIGGGDWAQDRIIPDIMTAFEAGRPVRLRNPHAIRPWQFVLEPLNGYLTLAERLWDDGPAFAEAWNFGPEARDMQSVAWLTDALAARWGEGAVRETDVTPQPHETTVLKLDCSHAHGMLGWRPVQTLDETLDGIVAWYRACYAGEDMRALTLGQIQDFQGKATHG